MNDTFSRNVTLRVRACVLVALAFCAALVMPAIFVAAAEPAPAPPDAIAVIPGEWLG